MITPILGAASSIYLQGSTSSRTSAGGPRDYIICKDVFDWHTSRDMDFTVELWFKPKSESDTKHILSISDLSGNNVLLFGKTVLINYLWIKQGCQRRWRDMGENLTFKHMDTFGNRSKK